MLIDKTTGEVVFIDRNTLQVTKEKLLMNTKTSPLPRKNRYSLPSSMAFLDQGDWIKGMLLGIVFIAAILYAIISSVLNMADASAAFIDAINLDCTRNEQACMPININGDK
jgi:hypothetical protein